MHITDSNLSREVLEAYKTFGCYLISSTFELLDLWAQPHTKYTQAQTAGISSELPVVEMLEVYEIYSFFYDVNPETPAGIKSIIKGLELDLKHPAFVLKAKPQLLAAFHQINAYRKSHRLPLMQFPSLR